MPEGVEEWSPTMPEPEEVDLQPTDEMAANASEALTARRESPDGKGGMTVVGLARARDIASRTALTVETVRRMGSFFAQASRTDAEGNVTCAWQGWGGDAGRRWVEAKLAEIEQRGAKA
jgi:hypothetical protein